MNKWILNAAHAASSELQKGEKNPCKVAVQVSGVKNKIDCEKALIEWKHRSVQPRFPSRSLDHFIFPTFCHVYVEQLEARHPRRIPAWICYLVAYRSEGRRKTGSDNDKSFPTCCRLPGRSRLWHLTEKMAKYVPCLGTTERGEHT